MCKGLKCAVMCSLIHLNMSLRSCRMGLRCEFFRSPLVCVCKQSRKRLCPSEHVEEASVSCNMLLPSEEATAESSSLAERV